MSDFEEDKVFYFTDLVKILSYLTLSMYACLIYFLLISLCSYFKTFNKINDK